jgi:malonate-semialdehyde dehydrogenase (acetylating)/methylmalonate-semialdehyde dehydrogenase
MVPLWMFPIAIACGNAFVLKPSERDPSVSVRLAELLQEAGLPDGVMNVVHGDRQTVEALLEHPDVRAISFVGSTPVARSICARATVAGKRVQALGGAKNHMVVLPDADLEEAALAAVSAGYGSAGQRCMAISVVVAVEPVADALVERIARHTRELVVADGTTGGADLGPLITLAAKERVLGLVESGVREGAKLVCDGRTDVPEGNGFFVGPCLFDHVDPGMQIYREEIFGPVLAVIRARSFDDALRLVRPAWSASTCRFPYPSPATLSAAGAIRSSATPMSTAPRACASTPAPRRSRRAGPPSWPIAPSWVFRDGASE